MVSLTDQLIAVKTVIATPTTWTQQAGPRNTLDCATDAYDPNACKWCLLGAIEKVTQQHVGPCYYTIVQYLVSITPFPPDASAFAGNECVLATINDKYGFTMVHELLDAAITKSKEA